MSEPYIDNEMTRSALRDMAGFHKNLCSQFSYWGMEFKSNLGRRNVVMSQAQEHFFARELSKAFKDVEADGRTGKADIVIGEIDTELECKLTSGNRGSSVSYSLQTDWETLNNKGKLDYLYVLADTEFEEFAVLLFLGLTPDDFHPPATGSRGKSRMRKERAMKKCHVLWGSVDCKNEIMLASIQSKRETLLSQMGERIHEISNRISNCSPAAVKKKEKLISLLERETDRYHQRFNRLSEKAKFWQETTSQFTFNLSSLNEASEK